MNKGLFLSVSLHGLLLAFALVTWPTAEALKAPPIDAVQVDISQITDQSKRVATTTEDVKKSEKPAPQKAEPKPQAKPAPKVSDEVKTVAKEPEVEPPKPEPPKPEPPKPEPPKPEPPKPEPKKVEEKPLDPDPLKELLKQEELARLAEAKKQEDEKKKIAEQKRKDDEKKLAEEKKKKDDELKKAEEKKRKLEEKKLAEKKKKKAFDDIAAFLNKEDAESSAPQKASAEDGSPTKAEKVADGKDAALAATIVDALVNKVRGCFNVPAAARDSDLSVKVKFKLDQDGYVTAVQAVPSSDPVVQVTSAAAVSAIKGCEPYELPLDQYDLWKDNTLDFNPNLFG
jgi:outer membrane biosynthesis protein TonB